MQEQLPCFSVSLIHMLIGMYVLIVDIKLYF